MHACNRTLQLVACVSSCMLVTAFARFRVEHEFKMSEVLGGAGVGRRGREGGGQDDEGEGGGREVEFDEKEEAFTLDRVRGDVTKGLRDNLEKMAGKDLAIVLHHLEKKEGGGGQVDGVVQALHKQLLQQVSWCWSVVWHVSHVTRHTSHVTRHTSHVKHNSSLIAHPPPPIPNHPPLTQHPP